MNQIDQSSEYQYDFLLGQPISEGCYIVCYVFLFALRVSFCDLEEILVERGVVVDNATPNRWVIKYSPLVALKAHTAKRKTNRSWRMDETDVRVKRV